MRSEANEMWAMSAIMFKAGQGVSPNKPNRVQLVYRGDSQAYSVAILLASTDPRSHREALRAYGVKLTWRWT